MDKLVLNVYDDDDQVIKSVEGKLADIKYGTIRALMKLLKVEDIDDTAELLKVISVAWDKLTAILDKCFPDMTDEDWDNVKVNELIPMVMLIVKFSAVNMMQIPKDSKNLIAE